MVPTTPITSTRSFVSRRTNPYVGVTAITVPAAAPAAATVRRNIRRFSDWFVIIVLHRARELLAPRRPPAYTIPRPIAHAISITAEPTFRPESTSACAAATS